MAALAAFTVPFFVSVTLWPEIASCAYFVSRGSLLYDQVFFPHTPLLILLTAGAGALFGFSAPVLRAVVALPLAASGALLVLGLRPHRKRTGWPIALVAVPILVCWTVYAEGPALWPDPYMAPLLLGAGLLLERFERAGHRRLLFAAGLLLGTAILVKQTSAWVALAALLWCSVRSRRRGLASAALLAAAFCLPYLLFVFGWGAAFRTLAHVRWTLLVPLQMGRGHEILAPPGPEDVAQISGPFLAIVAFLLAAAATLRGRLRTPLPWMAVGALGMAYPRGGLLHLAAPLAILTLLLGRAALLLSTFARRARRRSPGVPRIVLFATGCAAAISSAGVALLGGGGLLLWQLGGPAFYWDDKVSLTYQAAVRRRLSPGDEFVVFVAPNENLYARTGTRMPGGIYVNTSFWYCLNKEGVEGRLLRAMTPGTLVLFREPEEDEHLKKTELYRFLKTSTEVVEGLEGAEWRRVTSPPPR